MALNKNALIRIKTIDKCLQNNGRLWTLEDLMQACSDALYEYEHRDVNVSKRTTQLDIQLMRSDKLGYNAPIEVFQKKYYRYADADYTIAQLPIGSSELSILSESVAMLKQFQHLALFDDLQGVVEKLEDKIYSNEANRASIIHLDKNNKLQGLEHLNTVYNAIARKFCLDIEYRSFKSRSDQTFTFQPFILKEFNNRWFIVGCRSHQTSIITLALDRIVNLAVNISAPYKSHQFNADEYYKDTVGVTVKNETPSKVIVWVDRQNAPYVRTKPLHHSQKLIRTGKDGSHIFSLTVQINYELERLLLGFGESLIVLAPKRLKRTIFRKLNKAQQNYREDGIKNISEEFDA